jgi:RHS repeat-associated protein
MLVKQNLASRARARGGNCSGNSRRKSGNALELSHYKNQNWIRVSRNEFLYTGRRRDPETGLQLNRNRYYHQQLGRWVNRDPIGYEGSQWNLYEYANGMPVDLVDFLGMQPIPCGQNNVGQVLRSPPGVYTCDLPPR